MIAGRDPVGMAAASIYYSSAMRNDGLSQITIADAAGITPVTVRNRYHEIKRKIEIQNDQIGKPAIIKIDSNDKSNFTLGTN